MSLFKFLFKSTYDQFELSNIGSFDSLTFDALSSKILILNKGFTVRKQTIENGFFLGIFESPHTKLSILYAPDGSFISKKEETWK